MIINCKEQGHVACPGHQRFGRLIMSTLGGSIGGTVIGGSVFSVLNITSNNYPHYSHSMLSTRHGVYDGRTYYDFEYLGRNALDGNTFIKTLTVDDGLKGFFDNALANCPNLTAIIFGSAIPPSLGSDVFKGSDNLTTIYVPAGSKTAYQAIPQFSVFNIIEANADEVQVSPPTIKLLNYTGTYFRENAYVEITHDDPDVTIYYTATQSSLLYTEPFLISGTYNQISAFAVKDGMIDSVLSSVQLTDALRVIYGMGGGSRPSGSSGSSSASADTSTTPPTEKLEEPPKPESFTTADVLNILRYVAGVTTLTPEQRVRYDTDGDGVINTADALNILRYIAGIIKEI